MRRVMVVVLLAVGLGSLPGVGEAAPKSGSTTGTAIVECPWQPDRPRCGTRFRVEGDLLFTLTPARPVDLDVYFYDRKGQLTDQFTTTGCEAEFGRVSKDAVYAVTFVPLKPSCGAAEPVDFTYSFRERPGAACPEGINETCRPLIARLAVYGVLGLLAAPPLLMFARSRMRRKQDKRKARTSP